MAKQIIRSYSRYSLEAAAVLGKQIKLARKQRHLTAQDLADRAGISRGLLQRIEKGDPKCELGATLEVATLVGVTLFEPHAESLTPALARIDDKLALLPHAIRPSKTLDDDF